MNVSSNVAESTQRTCDLPSNPEILRHLDLKIGRSLPAESKNQDLWGKFHRTTPEKRKYLSLSADPTRLRTGVITMNAEFETEEMQWMEDLGGLSLDELRDLPFSVQAGLDTSVFE